MCGLPSAALDSLTFVKASAIEELFESIIVFRFGDRGEVVAGQVGASVTFAVASKILGIIKHLTELDENQEMHWTKTTDDAKARQWEDRLLQVAPQRATEWAASMGPAILEATKAAREVVPRYLACLELSDDLEFVLNRFERTASSEIRNDVERLLHSPGGGLGHGGLRSSQARHIAYYALLVHSGDVEQGKSFLGLVPGQNHDYLQRIHILSDRILRYDHRTGNIMSRGNFV